VNKKSKEQKVESFLFEIDWVCRLP